MESPASLILLRLVPVARLLLEVGAAETVAIHPLTASSPKVAAAQWTTGAVIMVALVAVPRTDVGITVVTQPGPRIVADNRGLAV